MLSKLTACRWWLTGLLILLTTIGFSQQKTVSGTVTSGQTKEPVFGATVSVKGTNFATFTNEKGAFTLTVPPNNNILVVSFVGFEPQEVSIANKSNVDVNLSEK